VNVTFHGAGNDRTFGVVDRGVVDDAVAEQWPVLHQPEHDSFLLQRMAKPA
jgi:hypothetical protein